MLEWLERRFKSAYLKKLEDDNARLTDELRQLMNSILLSHNMPGIAAPQNKVTIKPWVPTRIHEYLRRKERESLAPPPAQERKEVPDA